VTFDRPLSPRDCADPSGLSYDTVLRAIRAHAAGRPGLPAYRPPGSRLLLIRPGDLEEWLYGHPVPPAVPEEPRAQRRPPTPAGRGSFATLPAIERGTAA
jgi:hypothetical protein